jgi:hypothetical protein
MPRLVTAEGAGTPPAIESARFKPMEGTENVRTGHTLYARLCTGPKLLIASIAAAAMVAAMVPGTAQASTPPRSEPAAHTYTWNGMHLTAAQYEAVQILHITRPKGMKLPKDALGITNFGPEVSGAYYEMCLRFTGMCVTTDPIGDAIGILGLLATIFFGVKAIKVGKKQPPKDEPEEQETDDGLNPADTPPDTPDPEEGDEPYASGPRGEPPISYVNWAPSKDCRKNLTWEEQCTWISVAHEGGLAFESLYGWYHGKALWITCPHPAFSQKRSYCKLEKTLGKAGEAEQTWDWVGPVSTGGTGLRSILGRSPGWQPSTLPVGPR